MAKIVVYTTNQCPYCMEAKELLRSKGIKFETISLNDNDDLREELVQKYNYRTVPMIFINEEFIGGFKELQQLVAEGKL